LFFKKFSRTYWCLVSGEVVLTFHSRNMAIGFLEIISKGDDNSRNRAIGFLEIISKGDDNVSFVGCYTKGDFMPI